MIHELNELREAIKGKDNATYISYLIFRITNCMINISDDFDKEFEYCMDDIFKVLTKITTEYMKENKLGEEQYIAHLESVYCAYENLKYIIY